MFKKVICYCFIVCLNCNGNRIFGQGKNCCDLSKHMITIICTLANVFYFEGLTQAIILCGLIMRLCLLSIMAAYFLYCQLNIKTESKEIRFQIKAFSLYINAAAHTPTTNPPIYIYIYIYIYMYMLK